MSNNYNSNQLDRLVNEIEGRLNDFDTGITDKDETIKSFAELIIKCAETAVNSIPMQAGVKPEIADLTVGQKIDAILLWQNSEEVHPLTCGCSATNNDEKKFEIVGKRLDGKLFIECSRCGVIQDWIPDSVYNYYILKQFSV